MGVGCLLFISLFGGATLIEAPGVNLVRAHCSSCHSERLITQNRGTRDDWERTIRWMQQTQNLWPIPEADERTILDYLATNYPPGRAARRPPLHVSLMPRPHQNEAVKRSERKNVSGSEPPVSRHSDPSEPGCACHSGGARDRLPSPGWWLLAVLLVTFRPRR